MADRYALARLKKGVDVWNTWRGADRRKGPFGLSEDIASAPSLSHADLRGLDLAGAYLVGCDLQSSDLRKTRLRGANLRGGKLYMSDLRGADMVLSDVSQVDADWADFSGANMRAIDLRNSVLREAKFVRSNLKSADIRAALFVGADLTRADMTNALIAGTIFGDTTLRTVKGLDTCYHEGVSIIDYHTLVKSGELPVQFLRECGLSNGYIAKLPDVLDEQAPLRCFISYSVKDERIVERLDSDLQGRDIRCWYFRKHAVVGRVLEQDIAERIAQCDKVILICSEAALCSPEVLKEVELASQKEENTGERVLVPITVDDYVFGPWRHKRKKYVIEKMICNFKGWNRNATRYDTAFERLFRALNGATEEDENDEE